ncbi:MAG: response regulator [Bacteroidales bacterium]|nr:response regulator [Bacteroidales bacterium]
MAGLIIINNPKALLNRLASVLFFTFFIWSFSMVFVHNIHIPKDTAFIFNKISSFGWISFPAISLCLFLVYAEKRKILNNKLICLLIFILPVILIYIQHKHHLIICDVSKQTYGWEGIWSNSIWATVYFTYFLVYLFVIFYILGTHLNKIKNSIKIKPLKLIIITIIITSTIGFYTNIIQPLHNIRIVPDLGDVSIIFWSVGIYYAIIRYKLFTITPEKVAEDIIETMSDTLLLLDHDRKIIRINSATIKLFEYSEKELIGQLVDMFFENEVKELFEQKNFYNKERILITKTGKKIPILFSGSILTDKKNRKKGIVCLINDISELKLARQKLISIEEANKLKTAFVANMSHEIRTPMNAIIGFSEVLLQPDLSVENKQEYLGYIINSGNNLLNIIDDIIDISKIEAGQVKIEKISFNIDHLLFEIYTYYNEKKDKNNTQNIDIKYNINDNYKDIIITTDPNRFRQILTNLIENALKYTNEGYIEIGYNIKNNEYIRFYVKDTGIGIPNDKFDEIFERFGKLEYSENKTNTGTGLGLSISKNLVKLLGGEIWVESNVNKGSTFYFTIPYVTTTNSKNDLIETTITINNNNNNYNWSDKTILVAEDEDDSFLYINEILIKTKVNILRAKNGFEAIEICRTNNNIDLILMDIKMPEIDGYEAMSQIKKIRKDIPVICQTAYATESEKKKCLEAGCLDYITKPIKTKVLLEKIAKVF